MPGERIEIGGLEGSGLCGIGIVPGTGGSLSRFDFSRWVKIMNQTVMAINKDTSLLIQFEVNNSLNFSAFDFLVFSVILFSSFV